MKTIYLACAYSHKGLFGKLVMWYRARVVTRVAAKILERGFNVFSPITHSHHIAVIGKLPQLSHEFWLNLDKWYVDRCDEIWVLDDFEDAWRESTGVNREIEWGLELGKPVKLIDEYGHVKRNIHYVPNGQ